MRSRRQRAPACARRNVELCKSDAENPSQPFALQLLSTDRHHELVGDAIAATAHNGGAEAGPSSGVEEVESRGRSKGGKGGSKGAKTAKAQMGSDDSDSGASDGGSSDEENRGARRRRQQQQQAKGGGTKKPAAKRPRKAAGGRAQVAV